MSLINKNLKSVVSLYEETYDKFIEVLCGEGLITSEPWSSIASSFKDCLDMLNDNAISGLSLDSIKLLNPIDKFDLSSQVKTLYESHYSPKDISLHLKENLGIDVSKEDVERWIKEYNHAPVTRPNEGKWGSVFDVGTQLQILFEDIHTMTEEVKNRTEFKGKSDKSEILLAHSSEKRQILKDAKEVLTAIKIVEDGINMKKIILEEVAKESPACAQRIIHRFRDVRQASSILM
jgi:hypothetical protein